MAIKLVTIFGKSGAILFLAPAMLLACSSATEELLPSEQSQSPSQSVGAGYRGEGYRGDADPARDEICDEADLGPGECPE